MLLNSLKVQYGVVIALIIKELQVRFGVRKLGYVWIVLEPTLHIIPFFFIRKLLGNWKVDELIIFIATGVLVVMFFTKVITKVQASIVANKNLFVYRQVKPIDVAIARVVIESIIFFILFILVILVFWVFTDTVLQVKMLESVIYALILLVIISFSFGLIAMIIITRLPFLEVFLSQVVRILYFISGAFFSVGDLPYSVKPLVLLNPIVHIVEILRFNMLEKQTVNYGNLGYVAMCIICVLFFALFLYMINKRRLI